MKLYSVNFYSDKSCLCVNPDGSNQSRYKLVVVVYQKITSMVYTGLDYLRIEIGYTHVAA